MFPPTDQLYPFQNFLALSLDFLRLLINLARVRPGTEAVVVANDNSSFTSDSLKM